MNLPNVGKVLQRCKKVLSEANAERERGGIGQYPHSITI